ncbi:MAG: FAD:protein FMN transferase [Paracoccaceae bacterium]
MLTRRRFLTIAAAGAACPAGAAPSVWRGRALGADVTLRLAGAPDPAGRIWRRVERLLRGIEAEFSLFRDSSLTRLNRDGRLAWPSPEMLALLDLAGRVHAATGGAFDPTVQPLWQAVARGGDPAPARDLTGWDGLRIAKDEIALRPGMALTLNGIAQGHAADRLAALLRAEGFAEVLIDAGELRALGRNGTRDWQAGIAGPDGALLDRISLADRALATSSPMGTRIGRGQPHILHPDGRGTRWNTVSVSAGSAALADALSTGFCLMSRAEIERALGRFAGARLEYLG